MFPIAIVTPNTLMAVGLKQFIQQMMPMLEVRTFMQWYEVNNEHMRQTAHFFIDEQCLQHQPELKKHLPPHTIILTAKEHDGHFSSSRPLTLCVQQQPEHIRQALLQLMRHGHFQQHKRPIIFTENSAKPLTRREQEVLVCVVKGMINKEIAEVLHISPTTVITHRKNITEKLNIKSAAGLTLYAVLNGIVDPQEVLAR